MIRIAGVPRAEILAAEAIAEVNAYDRRMRPWTRDQCLGWHVARGDSQAFRRSEAFQAGYLFAIATGRDVP